MQLGTRASVKPSLETEFVASWDRDSTSDQTVMEPVTVRR